MDVIVPAGGIPERGDPLYAVTQGGYKAMLDIAGKPMIQWVLNALSQAPSVQRVAVVGLPPITALDCEKPLIMLPDLGDMVENVRSAALELAHTDASAQKALVISTDLPAITAEMIEWLIARVEESDHDLYGFVIERSLLEALDRDEHRIFAHLKDTEVCLADVAGLKTAFAGCTDHPLWQQLAEARKSPMRQAAILGYDVLFLLTLRQQSIEEAQDAVNRRLKVDGHITLCPYPELALDVDRPHQVEDLRDYLAGRLLPVDKE